MIESHRITDIRVEIGRYISEYILFDESGALDENLSFQESGILDSMGFLELVTFIEEHFMIRISDHELIPENFDTLRKTSDFVEHKLREKTAA